LGSADITTDITTIQKSLAAYEARYAVSKQKPPPTGFEISVRVTSRYAGQASAKDGLSESIF
jgi:hypothetical protein